MDDIAVRNAIMMLQTKIEVLQDRVTELEKRLDKVEFK